MITADISVDILFDAAKSDEELLPTVATYRASRRALIILGVGI